MQVSLSEAAARYAETVKNTSRQQAMVELGRFVKWFGGEESLARLRGHDVSLYAEILGPTAPETTRRAGYIRDFLAFLKKEGLTESNLAPHLRLRKAGKSSASASARQEAAVELTQEGVDSLRAELESLMEQRMAVRDEIRRAMLDKDFRENAPLDAAKDKQGHIEARIREIESTLKRAVVVGGAGHGGRVKVGTTVIVHNLDNGSTNRFVIVGPTEANASEGKISSVSPVGKALLNQQVGAEVEVSVPRGVMRFRVEEILAPG